MQIAIDQYNQVSEEEQEEGEDNVKKIAHMFKLINMQQEGMKFYTNFIMLGKHSAQSTSVAAEQSTMKQIEGVIVNMYHSVEDSKLKITGGDPSKEAKPAQLLEECSFS
jgi:hypothetical protein